MTRLAYLAFHSVSGRVERYLLSLLESLDRARFALLVLLSWPGALPADPRRREVSHLFESRMGPGRASEP